MNVRLRRGALWARAVEIFGSETKADSWFHTRLSELADRATEEVFEEDINADGVATVLDRIEYGVFG